MDDAIEKGLLLAIRIDGLEAAGRQPFHRVDSDTSGAAPWRVGMAEVRMIPRADEWNRWAAYRATHEGALSSREEARGEVADEYDLKAR